MVEHKVVRVENSLGVLPPREVLSRLHLEDDDKLILTESPAGGYRLTACNPNVEQQMKAAEAGLRRYHNILKTLKTLKTLAE